MFKILLRLYLILIATYGAAIYLVPESLKHVFDERYSKYTLKQINGPLKLVQRTFGQTPAENWPALQKELADELVPIQMKLVSIDSKQLSSSERVDLSQGRLRVRVDSYGDPYLALAPLSNNQIAWFEIPPDPIDIALTYWAMSALIVAALLICLYLWLRPHWRDLEKLRFAAAQLGKGHLKERAAISPRSDIGGLAKAFDDMAGQLGEMIIQQTDLLNAVSHELRTPISRLKFGLALLQVDALPHDAQQQVELLERHVRELDELVGELLSFARLRSPQQSHERNAVELCAFLDSIVADFAEEEERRGVVIKMHAFPDPCYVNLSPKLTARAIQNLLGNALRYSHSVITVSAILKESDKLVITVEDDGQGIPNADRERIFEPFYRLDRSRDRATGGFGLGLAISRRAIEAQGGNISVTAGVSGGARFQIIMPIVN